MLIWGKPTQNWPGHRYGASWLAYDHVRQHSYVYVNIPKNASTWMTDVMGSAATNCRFNYLDDVFAGEYQSWHGAAKRAARSYIILLRDPVARWLSGFAQNQIGLDPRKPRHYSQIGWDRVFEKIVFDDHTEPQTSFVTGINTKHVVWFWVDKTLAQQVLSWSNGRVSFRIPDLAQDSDNRYNQGHRQTAQWFYMENNRQPLQGLDFSAIVTQSTDYLTQNPHCIDRLKNFYHHDYALIHHANFYSTTTDVRQSTHST